MDHALALRVIRVASRPIGGRHKRPGRSRNPLALHTAGKLDTGIHQLQVQNTIEDLAGNNVGKAFEVDLLEPVQRRFTNQVVRLPFEVR